VPASDLKAVGKDQSTSKFDEDALERSVRIRIVIGVRPVHVLPRIVVPQLIPPQGPKPPARPQVLPEVVIEVDTRVPWAIQELSGFNVAIGIDVPGLAGVNGGTVEYHFLLVNLLTRQMAQCRYAGLAGGASVGPEGPSFLPSMSATQGSHQWDRFETNAGTSFDDFAGRASWHEGALGLGSSISMSAITFHGLGINVLVTTGNTIGTPAALLSTGNFFLKPPVQLQL
jgi:hypothetical protein